MQAYFSTFTSGLQEIIQPSIENLLENVETTVLLDGLISYQTNANLNTIKKLGFVNNTFLQIKLFTDLTGDFLKPMVQWGIRHPLPADTKNLIQSLGITSFRVVTLKDNKSAYYNKNIIKHLEFELAKNLELKVNKVNPDGEIWLLTRDEGFGFFGFRITSDVNENKKSKGQLRPELANIMCLMSNPSANDVFLDPFAGHGTIAYERATFPHSSLILFEKDSALAKSINLPKAQVISQDFFQNSLADRSISKIVTDPPWGNFDNTLNVLEFYNKLLSESSRLLQSGGIAVILVARNIQLENYPKQSDLTINSYHKILVAGKKATIYILSKV